MCKSLNENRRAARFGRFYRIPILVGIALWSAAPSFGQTLATENYAAPLSASISKTGLKADFGKVLAEYLDSSLNQNGIYKQIQETRRIKHPVRGLVAKVGGALGEVVSINATEASKDGAKIALDESADWEDKDSLNLAEQKIIDRLHPKITAAVLQIAMGRGARQNEFNQELAKRGLLELCLLTAASDNKMNGYMERWQKEANISASKRGMLPDFVKSQKNIVDLTEAALQDDPVIDDIRQNLEKFARPRRLPDRLISTLQTILDTTAYMMPTPVIAAGVVAVKGALVVSTGGPEEDKLQHILVLSKRFSSRQAALKEEIQLAVNARQIADQTNNSLLANCADAVIENLVTVKALARMRWRASAAQD